LANLSEFEAFKALLISAASAGLVALGKGIREYLKENQESLYENFVKNIPFF